MVYLEPQLCWRPEPSLLTLKPVTAGSNNIGQLGLGDTENRGRYGNSMGDFLPAVSLGTNLTATAITASGGYGCYSGCSHTCALLSNGQLKCWGECHTPPFPSR